MCPSFYCVKMSYFIDICLICLEHSTNLIPIRTRNINGIIIEDKLKYILPKNKFSSHIPRYICIKCGNNLRYDHEFQQKCLQNITTYEKYAQQIITADSSYKYLSVKIRPDFVYEETEIADENSGQVEKKGFESNDTRNKHENIEKNVQISNNNDKVKLKNHLLSHSAQNKFENNERKSSAEKLSECKICNKFFKCSESLKKHHFTHINAVTLTCKICEKSFQRLTNLKRHLLIHTGEKPFTCEVCNRSFRHVLTLKVHKCLHTREKSFKCEICNESFRQLNSLKHHKLVHTGERPFKCEVCNKSYRKSNNLKQHKLVHTGGKTFTLNGHKLVHTGETPFNCEICNKSFRSISNLKRHKPIHSGEKPFTCDICKASYTRKDILLYHMKNHSSYKFECEHCDVKFAQRSTLKEHILDLHRKKSSVMDD